MTALRIGEVMTPSPHCINIGASIAETHELMWRHAIRHLVVKDDERVAGVVSIEDLHLLESVDEFDPESVGIEEALSLPAVIVSPHADVAEVSRRMLAERRDAVVVMDGSRLVGIFTTSDALRTLASILSPERQPHA